MQQQGMPPPAPQQAAAGGDNRPTAMDQLLQYKQQLQTDLIRVEAVIADMEKSFLNAEHGATGSVIKGFDAHLSSKEALRKRMQRAWKTDDRWFSLSSTTSPVMQEWLAEQDSLDPLQGHAFVKKGYPPPKGPYPQKGPQKR